MRQNRFVHDITSQADIGGEIRDMVVVEKTLTRGRFNIVEDTRRFLWKHQTQPVLDLTSIIKGVMALENLDLYNMEPEVGRSTTKIDLGIDLYDMEAGMD